MKRQKGVSILGIAASIMLAACASKGPVSSIGTPSAGAGSEDDLAAQYQQLIDNAMNPMICQQERVTGSRIHKREVCVRLADMESEREQALQLVHEIRDRATATPAPTLSPSRR